jgi:glycerol-3-phosphate dehydrogenase
VKTLEAIHHEVRMWGPSQRNLLWSQLQQEWDLIVVGGGITGAGILREATRAGLRTLLLEANDFASGTSSRSSKLVHGGFRYLKNAQVRLTFESVRERERLLKEGRGLVTPLGFLIASYRGDATPAWLFGAGLIIYDLLAVKWGHRRYDALDMHELCPPLRQEDLLGGYRYFDAQADDARLVLRVIAEAVEAGGMALNYARAQALLRRQDGRVCGVAVQDTAPDGNDRSLELQAALVINATGAWADELRAQIVGRPRLRRLRGSHLVFPGQRIPLTRAVSLLHPRDGRPVFAYPWEGITIIGTTDVDHRQSLEGDAVISSAEVNYLMELAQYAFPGLGLVRQDLQAAYSGVRPVVDTGKPDPSRESREHVLWSERGLLTVAGGKLTTFRLMAFDVLKAARARLSSKLDRSALRYAGQRVLDPLPAQGFWHLPLDPAAHMRLMGRLGAGAARLLQAAQPAELERIPNTPALWAELRWAAHAEAAVHLDDLLLRRVRLGLLLPQGGLLDIPSAEGDPPFIERIRRIVQPEMGWDDVRWQTELERYARIWRDGYQPPSSAWPQDSETGKNRKFQDATHQPAGFDSRH